MDQRASVAIASSTTRRSVALNPASAYFVVAVETPEQRAASTRAA
jgi:hypothetical protein